MKPKQTIIRILAVIAYLAIITFTPILDNATADEALFFYLLAIIVYLLFRQLLR